MHTIPVSFRRIEEKENLIDAIEQSLGLGVKKQKLFEGDILAIVSKVVALTEGGLVKISSRKTSTKASTSPASQASKLKRYGVYEPNAALDAFIRKEADVLLPGEMFLAMKNGILTPGAGVDTSNVPEGYAIGWPKNSYISARKIRAQLQKKYKIKKLGVLIFDSYILPLRNGVTGIALGYAGFHGIEDYRGKRDLFGNALRVTQRNIADGLACAATLVVGEGAESVPFVVLRDAPIRPRGWTDARISAEEIRRSPAECLYESLYPKPMVSTASMRPRVGVARGRSFHGQKKV